MAGLLASSGGFAPAPVAAQAWSPPSSVWLNTAEHTVNGLFLSAWRAHTALLGNPISEEISSGLTLNGEKNQNVTVQYFDNAALAYTPNDERGSDWFVQALDLGTAALKTDQANARFVKLPFTGSCGKLSATDCRSFAATKHTVKNGFLTYWGANGGDQLIGSPISEEFVARSGWTVQYFERAVLQWKQDKGVVPRAIGQETARLIKVKTTRIAQPDGVPAFDEALFVQPAPKIAVAGAGGLDLGFGPGPQQGGAKEIVVSLTDETMWVYEDGKLVLASLVSTGVAHSAASTTPVGYFSILTKYDSQTMSGVIDDEAYLVPDVPWVMYFDDLGDALHGTYWHNNFGHPMSHGCVNQPMDVAKFMYGWAPIGTPVTVLA